jgi:hypothetical protein
VDVNEDVDTDNENKYEASVSPPLDAWTENTRSRVHTLDDDYSCGQIECEDVEFVDTGDNVLSY